MRIGLDFDNTIVSYDELFYKVAIEKSLIPANLSHSKLAVRNYLHKTGNDNAWTEMQGYVYGTRMCSAVAYPGVIEFLKFARNKGIVLTIMSHKTKHPFLGPKYDLHAAAKEWVGSYLMEGAKPLIEPDQVFFEVTKKEKVARIAEWKCDFFIDDLPEILLMPKFPQNTERILFDPENNYAQEGVKAKFESWQEIKNYFELKWKNHS